jgi:carbon monoxide dehydrogenase subunit G
MASLHKEILIDVPADLVWSAVRDYGAIQQLVPGIVVRVEGMVRIVTFPDGRVAHEILVDINDAARRLVYAEPGGRFITRSASMQIFAVGDRQSRLAWINDVLPDEFAGMIGGNMERGLAAMKGALERRHGAAGKV